MIYESVQKLIDYALQNNLITTYDVFVVRNQIIDALKLTDWQENDKRWRGETIDSVLDELVDYACENGIIENTANNRDLLDTKLMGTLTPMPREMELEFKERHAVNPKEATRWYYDVSKKLNYVRANRIAKDMKWTYECEYGKLDITINRSKPEKDPRDIAAAKTAKTTAYPKCQLCAENAGFAGHATHPARQNLRPISMTVGGGKWQFQYSPYGYYNEHCIFFNKDHIPMVIDGEVFKKLFDTVDYLPHYFAGSNADLPIVGGSILSHEHFQGGNYTFAMERASIETKIEFEDFPEVHGGIVKWPMSVIRVVSSNRLQIERCCKTILEKWKSYSDEAVNIFAQTDGIPHNTVTPIARKRGGKYECDIVLRNNLTTDDRPLGLFHPRDELHHIKKENIGLIEVMGLAVLPARLYDELAKLEKAMLAGTKISETPELMHHAEWADEILKDNPDFSKENAKAILHRETGKVFLEVLKDAGVFKRNEEGRAAFLRFVDEFKR